MNPGDEDRQNEHAVPSTYSRSSSSASFGMGYRQGSSSSSASSGKQLVKTPNPTSSKAKGDRKHSRPSPRDRYPQTHVSPTPSPEPHARPPPMFFIEPPSSPGSSIRYSPTSRSRSSSPNTPSTPVMERLQPHSMLHSGFNLELRPGQFLTPPDRNAKISSIYDAYWHIPRASLWCTHNGCHDNTQKCSQCQLKEETLSTCSSENPPPTFTAMDNYHPIRKQPSRCSCGAVFAATTVFSTFILLLIAAFILYIEMVLKRTEYVPDPM